MQTIADDFDMRIRSIEQRLDNMEKHAVTKGTLEEEFAVLFKKQADAQKHDCDNWLNAVLRS